MKIKFDLTNAIIKKLSNKIEKKKYQVNNFVPPQHINIYTNKSASQIEEHMLYNRKLILENKKRLEAVKPPVFES